MSLARRASAELAGTGLLVAAVVGSGIAATRLSPDTGLRLENSIATALALGALILTFGPSPAPAAAPTSGWPRPPRRSA